MAKRTCLAIILAAGEGTRMKSAMPKVMHAVGGLPMLGHVLKSAEGSGANEIAVVVGPGAEATAAFLAKAAPKASVHVQKDRLGTAHAVLAAKPAFGASEDVVILYGDTPMVSAKTLQKLRRKIADGADLCVIGFRAADPAGYGRLLMDGRQLIAIREDKDASAAERKINFCNAGIMAFRGERLMPILRKIGNKNAKGEYYLTDAVAIAVASGMKVAAVEAPEDEVIGVNDRRQLAHVEGLFQRHAREAAMANGVTMIAPMTVWFSHDTVIGRDVVVEPNVFFGAGVKIADNVTVRANSHIEGATISAGAIIGPFARLRPGAAIGANAHVGNFVEVKNVKIGEGAKANHLTYLGDGEVGARTNVGAGTITCNYDGFDKHRTVIGADVFVGSNTALVAPVTIGDGANIAAGSVIVHDVPADGLAIARARQEDKPGWAKKYREHKALKRNGKSRKSG